MDAIYDCLAVWWSIRRNLFVLVPKQFDLGEYEMITICTPIYNRSYIIDKLYQSLCAQTVNRFEWLVIDDGSTDNIREIIEHYIAKEAGFVIRYYRQDNGGKHRAINYALDLAKHEYFLIVDSDDYLSPDAIEKVYIWIEKTKDRKDLIGVSGQRANPDGKRLGRFPKGIKYIDVKQSEKMLVSGDYAEVYKTDILRTKRFPEFDGEKFIAEGALMYQFSLEGLKIRYYPDVIYYGEYLDDGLTKKQNKAIENYKGYCFFEKINIKACRFPYNLLAYIRYISTAREKGVLQEEVCSELKINGVEYLFFYSLVKLKFFIRRWH